ncbi:hypothetical protein [Grimontia hollisae]|uniref:Glycosyl transferases group 1 n=1 Tax=Grimontia hollisae TaxID=673 RepID=A0A377HLB7_GRIHO|nr:hypothetical protein [Grimontia hollisae]STO56906.1 Uncharacterised protein [Grimontia hollisae]
MSKILIVSRESIPKSNPAGLVAYRYASLFSKNNNIELISIIESGGNFYPEEYIDNNISIRNFVILNSKVRKLFVYINVFFYVLRKLYFDGFKTIITHTNPPYVHFYGLLSKLFTIGRVKWISSFTDPYSNSPFEKERFFSAGKIIRKIEELSTFKMSDNFIFVTETMRNFILQGDIKLYKKSIIIPFFYLSDMKKKIDNSKAALIKTDKVLNIVHPGPIYGNRDSSNLLKVLSKIHGVNLTVLGKVSNFNIDSIENVKIIPTVDYLDLLEIIHQSDFVIVIDSFFKTIKNPYMPSKVVDAMYMNKPIIGITDSGTELDLFLRNTGNISITNDENAIFNLLYSLYVPNFSYDSYSDIYINSYNKKIKWL